MEIVNEIGQAVESGIWTWFWYESAVMVRNFIATITAIILFFFGLGTFFAIIHKDEKDDKGRNR